MNTPLTDDVWKRKGISVLLHVPSLASLGSLAGPPHRLNLATTGKNRRQLATDPA